MVKDYNVIIDKLAFFDLTIKTEEEAYEKIIDISRNNEHTTSNCNWTRTHDHLVHKRTLNHLAKLASLAKWLSVRLRTISGCGFESSCSRLNFRFRACFGQGVP